MSLLDEIALTFIPGVGDVTARTLLHHFGSAEEIFRSKKNLLKAVPGIGEKIADGIVKKDYMKRAEEELCFVEKYRINVLSYTSDNYPERLKNCCDAPILLYYKGKADLNSTRIISIVGTRKATSYGRELTQRLIEDLRQHQVIVVSGLAYGIDGIAHKACIKEEIPTVGVIGHGLDRIYPAQHRAIAECMLDKGGLLTEFPSGTKPDRENFPRRNRIVAGIADATVIVEASIKGGALITAELANSYNRDVFAYPGDVSKEYSAGCNHLIKTNRANLITGVKDIEYLLGWTREENKSTSVQVSLKLDLSADEQKVTDLLTENGTLSVDALAIQTGMPVSKLAIVILGLEMQGIVTGLPGKIYRMA